MLSDQGKQRRSARCRLRASPARWPGSRYILTGRRRHGCQRPVPRSSGHGDRRQRQCLTLRTRATYTIRMITPGGVRDDARGLGGDFLGFADGKGSAARFRSPEGVAVDGGGKCLRRGHGQQRDPQGQPLPASWTTLAGSGLAGYSKRDGCPPRSSTCRSASVRRERQPLCHRPAELRDPQGDFCPAP